MPLRTALAVDGRGTAFFMPVYLREKRQIGLKVVSAFPGNPALGLPTVTAVVLVVDDFSIQARRGHPGGRASDGDLSGHL